MIASVVNCAMIRLLGAPSAPTVRGLRYAVASLLELLSTGMTVDEVLADYPDLERDDILAAL